MTNGDCLSLFCFPYAGGNSFAYRALDDLRLPGLKVEGVELPGRGRRTGETLCPSMEGLADDAFRQLHGRIGSGRYAFFGHSMGAALAFLTARRLRQGGFPMPEALILSGKDAPSVKQREDRHLLAKEPFLAELRTLGGCPPQLLEDRELMAFFEPILRADFKAVETWEPAWEPPLDIPFTVMIGTGDEIPEESALKWGEETTKPLQLHKFSGNHFFILRNWPQIGTIILNQLHRDRSAGASCRLTPTHL
jgi:surfactin synthase thioesterase subunit